uniref:uncharacterized protein LOC118525342 n=1 Tax=Halichoerus grypus TaxID=9711 RepID=UPI001659941D|nr:uncharacterized protein LOC118525342 [Halichoerus grypus]
MGRNAAQRKDELAVLQWRAKTKLKETRKDDDQVWEYVVVLSVLFRVFEILHELFTMEGGKKHNGVESDIVVSLFDPQLLLLYNGAINNPFGESLLRIICSDVCKVLSMSPRLCLTPGLAGQEEAVGKHQARGASLAAPGPSHHPPTKRSGCSLPETLLGETFLSSFFRGEI